MADPLEAQRVRLQRDRILEAAGKVFAEKGFHRATIRDIALEAGIADGIIYNYFLNKPALLFGMLDRMTQQALVEEDLAQLSQASLRDTLIPHFRYPPMADDSRLFQAIMSEIMVNDDLRQAYHGEVLAPSIAKAEALLSRFNMTRDMVLTVRTISALVMGDDLLHARWEELPTLLADLTAKQLAAAITTAVTDQDMCKRAAELGANIRGEAGIGSAAWVIAGVASG